MAPVSLSNTNCSNNPNITALSFHITDKNDLASI
jgi:hypothetical protein